MWWTIYDPSIYLKVAVKTNYSVCLYVHLDNENSEGDKSKLLLSKDYINLDVKTLNKIKGDEVIKKLHSLLTKSTETTCLAYVSS